MKYVQIIKATPLRPLPFPIDMLRYDACHPETEFSSNRIIESVRQYGIDPGEPILLRRYAPTAKQPLSHERWASYGWSVEVTDTRKL